MYAYNGTNNMDIARRKDWKDTNQTEYWLSYLHLDLVTKLYNLHILLFINRKINFYYMNKKIIFIQSALLIRGLKFA